MKRMLLVECSRMKTRKGLFIFMVVGILMGMTSMVVVAAASVPVSSTLRTALWDTCGGIQRKKLALGVKMRWQETQEALSSKLAKDLCNIYSVLCIYEQVNFSICRFFMKWHTLLRISVNITSVKACVPLLPLRF